MPESHPKLHKELCEVLRENVLHHQVIIQAYQLLEDIMNPIILVKYIQVTTLLCTLFVTILKVYASSQRNIMTTVCF